VSYLHPLVFNNYQGGFMCVNKAEHDKMYLDPVRGNLLMVFPKEGQDAYTVLQGLSQLAKDQLTAMMMSGTDFVISLYGAKRHHTTFTSFYKAGVERFVKYSHDDACFKCIRATEVRKSLMHDSGGNNNPLGKKDSILCLYTLNGAWDQYTDRMWQGQ
jgi:hypothetical protein